jgi:hypothetical protein
MNCPLSDAYIFAKSLNDISMALVAESVLLSAISISGLLLHENSIHNGTNKKLSNFQTLFACVQRRTAL